MSCQKGGCSQVATHEVRLWSPGPVPTDTTCTFCHGHALSARATAKRVHVVATVVALRGREVPVVFEEAKLHRVAVAA